MTAVNVRGIADSEAHRFCGGILLFSEITLRYAVRTKPPALRGLEWPGMEQLSMPCGFRHILLVFRAFGFVVMVASSFG